MDLASEFKTETQEIANSTERYINLHAERIKLHLVERISISASELIYILALGLFAFGCIIALCFALGFILAKTTGNWILGLSCGVGLFAILSVLFAVFGKQEIRNTLIRTIVQSLDNS